MARVLAAGALDAQADRADPHHAAVAQILRAEHEPLVTSACAVAEADEVMLTRLGIEVELACVEDLAEGTFHMECLTRPERRVALGVVRRDRMWRSGSRLPHGSGSRSGFGRGGG